MRLVAGAPRRIVTAIAISLMLFSTIGCAYRKVQRPPEASEWRELEECSDSRPVRIRTRGSSWSACSLQVKADSLQYFDKAAGQPQSVALIDVERLSVQNRSRGATYGGLLGLGIGLLLADQVARAPDFDIEASGSKLWAVTLGSGLLGAILGGYTLGWTHYETLVPPDAPSS